MLFQKLQSRRHEDLRGIQHSFLIDVKFGMMVRIDGSRTFISRSGKKERSRDALKIIGKIFADHIGRKLDDGFFANDLICAFPNDSGFLLMVDDGRIALFIVEAERRSIAVANAFDDTLHLGDDRLLNLLRKGADRSFDNRLFGDDVESLAGMECPD